jgi:hypothetical protein
MADPPNFQFLSSLQLTINLPPPFSDVQLIVFIGSINIGDHLEAADGFSIPLRKKGLAGVFSLMAGPMSLPVPREDGRSYEFTCPPGGRCPWF